MNQMLTKGRRRLCRHFGGILVIGCIWASALPGQNLPSVNGSDNGIAVGRPKIYDTRSLQIMLDYLNASLRSTQFVNSGTLAAALGGLQGSESFDVSRNLSVNASFLPKTAPPKASPTTNAASFSGAGITAAESYSSPSTATGSGSSGSSAASNIGNAAGKGGGNQDAMPTLPILAPSAGHFNENAGDLLADQVNLTYQVFNLRMLLERSLTDRLLNEPQSGDTSAGHARLQAVIGFDVTIDPPREAMDSAAIVEVTINAKDRDGPGRPGVSLVAMMPQEKTYNSAALNTHTNAFGGTAVAKVISVGYTEKHRGQVFYLFRDNDTIALERMPSDVNNRYDIVCGWQFRPVLGRRSVVAGRRQMFAVIALPDTDEAKNGSRLPNLVVEVKTYWRHYDHRSLSTTYHERWLHYIDPARIAEWPLRLPGERSVTYGDIEVPKTARVQNLLSPSVTTVEWMPTSMGTGTIVVHGQNFFAGTSISLAGQTYSTEADGLVIQSDQTMIIRTTAEAISAGNGVINGRYGNSVQLIPAEKVKSDGIRIVGAALRPNGPDFWRLTTSIASRAGTDLLKSTVPVNNAVYVRFNNTLLPEPAQILETTDKQKHKILSIETNLSSALLGTGSGFVTVKFGFGGRDWEDNFPVYQPYQPVVNRTGGKEKTTITLSIPSDDHNFSTIREVIVDKPYALEDVKEAMPSVVKQTEEPGVIVERLAGGHVAVLIADTILLDSYNKVILVDDNGIAIPVPIPPAVPGIRRAQLTKMKLQPLLLNEGRAVMFYGQGLGEVKRVFFNDKDLPFFASQDGKNLTIFVSPDVTSKVGHKDLILQIDPNTLIAGPIEVIGSGSGAGGANDSTNKKGAIQQ